MDIEAILWVVVVRQYTGSVNTRNFSDRCKKIFMDPTDFRQIFFAFYRHKSIPFWGWGSRTPLLGC